MPFTLSRFGCCCALALALLLTACELGAPTIKQALPALPAISHVTPRECIDIAEAYRTHRWQPTGRNVMHGKDARGVRVDTPDIGYQPGGKAIPGWWLPCQVNEGVPYQWGGFNTLAEFDAGIAAGKAAGDVYTGTKRELLDDAVSTQAVGIDCSGLISRCWKLPRTYSTRELPMLCKQIRWEDLKPGDIVNTHNAHCLLFAGWLDPQRINFQCYETGCPPTWKVMSHPIEAKWLRDQGYQPFRYLGMGE
jgi:hypothetical protein